MLTLALILAGIFTLAAVIVICASLMQCATCHRWHDCIEDENHCRQQAVEKLLRERRLS